jgi:hypothetical protein
MMTEQDLDRISAHISVVRNFLHCNDVAPRLVQLVGDLADATQLLIRWQREQLLQDKHLAEIRERRLPPRMGGSG